MHTHDRAMTTLIRALVIATCCLAWRTAQGDEDYGAWEVRRTRVSGADERHGFPIWNVRFTGSTEAPDIAIDGDRGGRTGGHCPVRL